MRGEDSGIILKIRPNQEMDVEPIEPKVCRISNFDIKSSTEIEDDDILSPNGTEDTIIDDWMITIKTILNG